MAIFAAGLLAASCGSPDSGGAAPPPSVPLNGSVQIAGSTWAAVPMGHTNQLSETFWQLFVLASGRGRWKLVTPPGVAANGGLSVGDGPSRPSGDNIVVGFVPSQRLGFSPLALSSTVGAKWAPETLPNGLAPVPQAVAAAGATVVALVGSGDRSSVVTNRGAGSSQWTSVTTERELAVTAQGRRCGLTGITAVARRVLDVMVVGGACSSAGTVGLFLLSPHTPVRFAAPVVLPGAQRDGAVIVTRITWSPARTVNALVDHESSSGARQLYEVSVGTSSGVSAALALAAGRSLIATGTTPAGGFFAVVDQGLHEVGDVIRPGARAGAAWTRLPDLPTGTATLAFGSAGRVDALVAEGSRMVDYRLESGKWRPAQVLHVPIAYGSSG